MLTSPRSSSTLWTSPRPLASRLALSELCVRARARSSLLGFYSLFEPRFHVGDWIRDLARNLEATDDWLLISAPVRHGKTQVVSRILPAFMLGQDPKLEVILVTATEELASGVGLYVKNLLNHPLYRELFPLSDIDPSSNSATNIRMRAGGGFLAVGAGTQIVGRGAGLMIVDDIYKDRAQAANVREREKIYQYFTSSVRTRLAPKGRMIVMAQRWAANDIVDTLLEQAAADPSADQYRHLVYPAVAPEPDHLGRMPGDPLHPERWPLAALEKARASMPEATWQAAYQQRPVAETGGFFHIPSFRYYQQLPTSPLTWYLTADFAASTKAWADKTAILPFALDHQRNLWFAPDYVYDKLESVKSVEAVIRLAKKYKPVGFITEKGPLDAAIRPLLNLAMRASDTWLPVMEFTRSDAKHVVAATLQGRIQQSAVFFPDTPAFKRDVLPCFMQFQPDVDGEDDWIDAASMGAFYVARAVAPALASAPRRLTAQEEDDEQWARIMAGDPRSRSAVPFERFNGAKY